MAFFNLLKSLRDLLLLLAIQNVLGNEKFIARIWNQAGKILNRGGGTRGARAPIFRVE